MKIVLKSLLMLSLCFISLTGCSTVKDDVEETADRFSGNVEIMWDDVKDELNQIEQDITGNSDNDLLEQEDVSVLLLKESIFILLMVMLPAMGVM